MQRRPRRPFHRARLRYDQAYRLELGYCYDHAIPFSSWLEDWTPEDRARVVAYQLEKGTRCQSCGTAEWEWIEDRYAYEPVRNICFGCQRKDLAREEDDGRVAGMSIVLIPASEAAKMRALQDH